MKLVTDHVISSGSKLTLTVGCNCSLYVCSRLGSADDSDMHGLSYRVAMTLLWTFDILRL
jgi:hypothetical protein